MTSQYFVRPDRASVEDFNIFCQQQVNKQDYPLVSEVAEEVLIYDHDVLAQAAATNKHAVLSELHQGLSYGPGVLVVRGLYQDMDVIDRASAVFETIMADESRTRVQADHFSRAGNNGRIWNALQKLAERSPQTFCDYYANEMLGLICQAWLGPAWRMTAQVNQVRPGGEAQQPHRDYHLGFQQGEFVAEFPIPAQILSQYLTLQGAVAHSDMPLASGQGLRACCRFRISMSSAIWPTASRSSSTTLTSTMFSCRCKKATGCFLTRRCFMPPGTTRRLIMFAPLIFCRSPRRSASRWKM